MRAQYSIKMHAAVKHASTAADLPRRVYDCMRRVVPRVIVNGFGPRAIVSMLNCIADHLSNRAIRIAVTVLRTSTRTAYQPIIAIRLATESIY